MTHHRDGFFDALAEDFNTPMALASLFEWVREANRRTGEGAGETARVGDAELREMLGVLGLGDLQPARVSGDLAALDPEAVALLQQREQARAERDFQTADRLREELRARGWEIRDGSDGAELIQTGER